MRIENKRTYRGPGTYVGRPSPLGNPFTTGRDGTRDEVIRRYALWLFTQLKQRTPPVIAAMQRLDDDSVLVCWCVPERCHAQVIERAWKWAKQEGIV